MKVIGSDLPPTDPDVDQIQIQDQNTNHCKTIELKMVGGIQGLQ